MQKFFEKTIESDFIKSLLYYTPISQYECVQDGDYLIGDIIVYNEDGTVDRYEQYGERYIYNGCIIKCTKSGIIGLSKVSMPDIERKENNEKITDSDREKHIEDWKAYVEENEAEYEILKDYNFAQYDYKTTPIFHSTTSYYDSRTHYALGKFLRAYRGMTGIDLMPYYNCYGYETVGGLHIGEKRIIEQDNPNKVIYSVPICWNRRYLIHIDKLSGIVLKAVLADDEGGLLKSSTLPVIVESNGSTEPIFTGGRTFNDPIEYHVLIQNQNDKNLMYGNRNNLRLLIQVNKGAESSLAVIETDSNFTSMMSKQPTRENKSHTSITINAESFVAATEKEQNESCFSQSKLTLMNTGEQYAYTDTLIQYLLKNVICKDDDISNNVGRVQKAVGHEVTDQWSDNLRVRLFNAQMEKGLGRLDIDGNVTKNVESMLRKEYSYKDYTLGE